MKNLSVVLILLFILSIISCGDAGVQYVGDSNDEEAIFNIMAIDREKEFRIDYYDLSIPDTSQLLAGPFVPQYYWYDLESSDPSFLLDIRYPDIGDSVGTVAEATVRKSQHFNGTFEIIAIDTSDGGNSPVRLSKNVAITGWIDAKFEKWGLNHNYRRGWLFKQISNVIYNSGLTLVVNSSQNDNVDVRLDRHTLGNVLIFLPGEEVTVTVNNFQSGDLIRLTHITSNGLSTIESFTNDNPTTDIQFTLPNVSEANHFFVNYISNEVLSDTSSFNSSGVGVLYSTF